LSKGKVNVSYTRAGRTPSKRNQAQQTTREPQGDSPLTRYVEENRDTGIPVSELIQQFQEYDCDHPQDQQHVVAAGTWYKFVRCARCHRVEKKIKPGVKDG
jgi:hypothetical protein